MITRRNFIVGMGALGLAGCAKFPPNGASSTATRLQFEFTLNGPIDPSYIYVVAIRVLTPTYGPVTGGNGSSELADPTKGPIPVVSTGSQNGFVGGLPTHYVVYVGSAVTPNLYQVFRFPLQSEVPNPSDPNTPINLLYPGEYVGDVIVGSPIDPEPTIPGGPYGQQLGFAIDTSYLDQFTGTNAQTGQANPVQVIQFNILTMNVRATSDNNVNIRVMDAIGDQSNLGNSTFSNPIQVNITGGGTYTDQTTGVPERAGDTFPPGSNLPAVDMTGWSLQVSLP